MRRLGLIGGPNSGTTAILIKYLQKEILHRSGGANDASLISAGADPEEVLTQIMGGDWPALTASLVTSARILVDAGAEGLLLDSNVLHVAAENVAAAVHVPLLSVTVPLVTFLKERRFRCVGLLGTRYRAEEEVLRAELKAGADADIVLPPREDRERIAHVIDKELALGLTRELSRVALIRLITVLKTQGARAIALVEPALTFLIEPGDSKVPIFNLAEAHARHAVAWALNHEEAPV